MVVDLIENATGTISLKKGYNLVVSKDGEFTKVAWMFYTKKVSGKSLLQEKNATILCYSSYTYAIDITGATPMYVKSLIANSSLNEK